MNDSEWEEHKKEWWRCPKCEGKTKTDDNKRYCTECSWKVEIPKVGGKNDN